MAPGADWAAALTTLPNVFPSTPWAAGIPPASASAIEAGSASSIKLSESTSIVFFMIVPPFFAFGVLLLLI
jgi:hypothetical protein